jgi:hypothetical protein
MAHNNQRNPKKKIKAGGIKKLDLKAYLQSHSKQSNMVLK